MCIGKWRLLVLVGSVCLALVVTLCQPRRALLPQGSLADQGVPFRRVAFVGRTIPLGGLTWTVISNDTGTAHHSSRYRGHRREHGSAPEQEGGHGKLRCRLG